MAYQTISFRIEVDTLEALDSLAASERRDRTFLLNQAVENYLDLQNYHDTLVREGLKAAKQGKFVSTAEMKERLTKLSAKRQAVK